MDRSTTAIIVNYRTADLTLQAVDAALSEPEVAEVIVVDNNSGPTDVLTLQGAVPERPESLRLVLNDQNVGFGQAVNTALSLVSTEFTALINSDAMLHPGCLKALTSALVADPALAVVGPRVLTGAGSTQPDAAGRFPSLSISLRRTNRHGDRMLAPDWISGVMMVLPTDALRSVGGFDPAFFMYYEDVDLCRRLHERGFGVAFVPAAVVTHLGAGSRRTARSQRAHARSAFKTYLRKADASVLERWALGFGGHLIDSLRTAHDVLVGRS
jgi:N-acetylglucosaminyl-diphospho-decaprenol L-rhamnosyltransferase